LADYRKNEYPELSADVRSELARGWQRSFDEWGYPTG
jgi:hypothetical protein